MSTRRIAIRLDDKLLREVKQAARGTGQTESQFVRIAIERYLRFRRRRQSCYDLAVRAKLIGAANALPPDLSTNQRHLAGFGRDFQ
ncbi:MAG TPA: ribbon-helix-helix protein, CopG family [Tepidisphaeraceae bacterium]|nr:ribbon-helix-helix protein, CopG family [Tepidisphaeraceae bacterium]